MVEALRDARLLIKKNPKFGVCAAAEVHAGDHISRREAPKSAEKELVSCAPSPVRKGRNKDQPAGESSTGEALQPPMERPAPLRPGGRRHRNEDDDDAQDVSAPRIPMVRRPRDASEPDEDAPDRDGMLNKSVLKAKGSTILTDHDESTGATIYVRTPPRKNDGGKAGLAL